MKTSYTLYGQDGSPPQELAGKANYHFKYGDVVSVVVAGGGGYGNPLEREVALVEEDVAKGYVTIEGAYRDYGVEIDPKTGKGRRVRFK
jgi:N-methylhydantoinase B